MKVVQPRIVASVLGAVGVVALGWGVGPGAAAPRAEAQAQAGGAAAKAAQANFPAWTAQHASPQAVFQQAQQQQQQQQLGVWAEVISATQRWVVVQTQEGQQFPIAADRMRQYLVRWPSSLAELTPTSMVEATGIRTSSAAMMTDHVDVYEENAQGLVSPTIQSVAGPNGQPAGFGHTSNFGFIDFESLNFGAQNWTEMPSAGNVNWTEVPNVGGGGMLLHVVGRPNATNPLQLTGFGPGAIMVAPGPNGMSVTQVTHGTMGYFKKGDPVHLVAEGASPRGLDVNQLVLYKKIPLRRFQP